MNEEWDSRGLGAGAVEEGGMASGSSSNSESLSSAEVLLTASHCRQFIKILLRLALPCCDAALALRRNNVS